MRRRPRLSRQSGSLPVEVLSLKIHRIPETHAKEANMPFKSVGKFFTSGFSLSGLTQRAGSMFGTARSLFGDATYRSAVNHETSVMLGTAEEVVAGLVLASVTCYASEFLPFWVDLLIVAGGFGGIFAAERSSFPVFFRTLLSAFALFVAFSQPWGAVLGVCGLTGYVTYRSYQRSLSAWWMAAAGGTFVGATVAYLATSAFVVPFLHPLTVFAYNAGPLIFVGLGVLTCLYSSWRLLSDPDNELVYRLAPGVCALLFLLFFPMKNSWVGLGVEALFVAASFAVAFRGSRALLASGTVCGAVFGVGFLAMNGSTFLHDVAMAQSMDVRYVDKLPETNVNRVMPLVVGRDFCVQGNDANMIETGDTHAQIMDGKYYWQCPMHYTGFQINHLFSWFPGSTAGFVMVDAGTTASDTRVKSQGFIFGENSFFVKAAFEVRHPGATMAGFSYAGVGGHGDSFALLIPYTVNKLYWGAMVPTIGGVMVVSPWGTIEDYTVGQAARAFPGTFIYPSELARQYADVWGRSTVGKIVTRSALEVSEAPQAARGRLSNPFPYGIDTVEGPKYFVPYEPEGKNGTAMSDVAFFDGALGDGDVTVMHLADSKQPGSKNELGHRSVQGPRELLEKSANVIQGHFQLTSIEPIIIVTKSNRLFFITSNMGPDQSKSNHDYQGDTLSYETGEPQWVVTSSAEVKRHIEETESQLDAGAPLPSSVRVPAPDSASPVPNPVPTPAVTTPSQSN
ncbi:MAG: hypothetical protein KGS72_04110 [Cyanobacteria bacterium REEB67]|nr:hypothetical protein [Cyanobacteria bacterium REEB67]